MLSCDSSYDSSSDSEAAEVEVEYDLEVEGSSNPSEHETSDDQPDAYANEPMADEEWLAQYEEERKTEEELGMGWSEIPSALLGLLLQPKTTHLSGIFKISDLPKRSKRGSKQESDQWPGMTSQISLYPDPFQWLCDLIVFWKSAIFPIFKTIIKNRGLNRIKKFLRHFSQFRTEI